jgi:hypothetical protein
MIELLHEPLRGVGGELAGFAGLVEAEGHLFGKQFKVLVRIGGVVVVVISDAVEDDGADHGIVGILVVPALEIGEVVFGDQRHGFIEVIHHLLKLGRNPRKSGDPLNMKRGASAVAPR